MKRLAVLLALVALVAVMVQPADAGRKIVIGQPLKWLKTNSSTLGAYVTDSTRVAIVWSGKESANSSAGSDTTMAFDIRNVPLPTRTWATGATDSTGMAMLLGFRVDSWATTGAWAASTDSSQAYTQFSYDGLHWGINAGSGVITNAWFLLPHAVPATGNVLLPAMYYLNRNAMVDNQPPFWRVVVANIGAGNATTGKLVRYYEVRPVYWVDE